MSIEVFALLPEQEKITTEFEKVPLEEAIESLIRNYPHLIVSHEGDRKITRIVALQKSGDPVLSKPVTKETEIKTQEAPVKLDSRVKEQAIRKESPPPEPFRFKFDLRNMSRNVDREDKRTCCRHGVPNLFAPFGLSFRSTIF